MVTFFSVSILCPDPFIESLFIDVFASLFSQAYAIDGSFYLIVKLLSSSLSESDDLENESSVLWVILDYYFSYTASSEVSLWTFNIDFI